MLTLEHMNFIVFGNVSTARGVTPLPCCARTAPGRVMMLAVFAGARGVASKVANNAGKCEGNRAYSRYVAAGILTGSIISLLIRISRKGAANAANRLPNHIADDMGCVCRFVTAKLTVSVPVKITGDEGCLVRRVSPLPLAFLDFLLLF